MNPTLTTDQIANLYKVKPTSIRSALSTHGSYFGLIPKKLPNGRLVWDREQVEALLQGKTAA